VSIAKATITATLREPYGEAAYKVAERLIDAGYDTWWVGGCVRDMLQGKIPKDIDIATAALPQEVLRLFPGSKDTGIAYGSVRAKQGRFAFEVTTFREDDEASDGRHPASVVFGTREKDAARRDFTVNALYMHTINHTLYDPYGGEADLHEKLIRFIGEPGIRIKHDALRIFRAVRFRALLQGQYHPETYQALREQASLAEGLAGTRVFEELEKMLFTPVPSRALEDLWELGVLPYVMPELHRCKGIPQPGEYHQEGDVWDHLLASVNSSSSEHGIDVRIAALFHDIGKAVTFSLKKRIMFAEHASVSGDLAKGILDRLQCPSARREKITWLIRHHMMMGEFFTMGEARKAHWYFHPWFGDLLQLFFLDCTGTRPQDFSLYNKIVQDYQLFLNVHPRPEKALLDGHEIMELLSLPSGEAVGEAMAALHEVQTSKSITSKAEAKAFILAWKKGIDGK
jgi:poly(A) polymerase